MRYEQVEKAVFLSRPNRFLAKVLLCGKEETVHVKNTGRCKELLTKGAVVYLAKGKNQNRKTAYDLIAVEKSRGTETLLINMDSSLPNAVAAEWLSASRLFSPAAKIKREVTFANSRFDLFVEDGERRAFLEVKGVTLEKEGIAFFPDAPTKRGVKHLRELAKAVKEGYEGYLLFVAQMKGVREVRPNDDTDLAFGNALREAAATGVRILAVDCTVYPDAVTADAPLPVVLFDPDNKNEETRGKP